jgi:hypothetical protein
MLAEHLEHFILYLGRCEQHFHMVNMIKDLQSDLERNSIEPIALAFAGKVEVRNMANFMTRLIFDDDGMPKEYQKQFAKEFSAPGGMITGNGCDIPKKGKNSFTRNGCDGIKRWWRGPDAWLLE